ncbi:reverse transcriptase-like protein [Ornithinibacillus sp. L9]|uniref:Reverse transcriptase-like protein n=1 Tax=Ornithinibacillus caprae TaxID=2678566 RepID=A0A6N8FEC1_9BACI|nr:ribonuclease H family protein [Ornithinibacillus caprae]MUK88022.1 reverse transcriptase-like protein [Ornithinibacillus caprae]
MKVRLEIVYRTKKGTETSFVSDYMQSSKALLIVEDLEKTGRLKEITLIDSHDTSWTTKELKKQLEGIQTEPHDVTIYFDGGFDLKTKKSGLGCAVYYQQNGKSFRLRKNAHVDELDTNNEAEYAAFHLGLQEIEQLGVHHLPVTFVGDSQVVINQLNGEWPVYEEELSKWADRIEAKLQDLGIQPEYELVSRKQNREADHLASQALKGVEISSVIEMEE